MFRIQENTDGTTSIFCKNSGNLVCTIPTKGTSCSHRPVNVVEPQLANEAPSSDSWSQLKTPSRKEPDQEEKDDSILTSVSLCSLPLPKDEDYRLDSATQDQFAKCLGLVSAEEFRTHPLPELLAEWPLRLLSKSTAFRTSENGMVKEIKVPDQLPITSSLGVRLLRLNMSRHFASPERVSQSLRSYESFCRHPYNTACPSACHFPKLRCRGEKAYPVQTPSRVMRHLQTAHVYTRGRRQRQERKRTLRTGLDARSRRLLRLCNAKQCTVDVVRLSQSEIDDWLSRVTTIDIVDSEDEDSEPECYIPRPRLPPRRGQTCSVRLRNIVMDIKRRDGTHYVRNSHIKVPFYRDFLSSLMTNRPLFNAIYMVNGDSPMTKCQQSLKPKPSAAKQALVIPPIKSELVPVGKKVTALPVSNKLIPCIDLTLETTPPKQYPPPTNRSPIFSGQKVVVDSGGQVGVNSRQKVIVNSGMPVGVNNRRQVLANSGQRKLVGSDSPQVFPNSKQRKLVGCDSPQVFTKSGQRKLVGSESPQVLVNAQNSKPNGDKHRAVEKNRQRPVVVNGRNLIPNDRLVVVNSGRPQHSKIRVVAEDGRRPTTVNRRSRQVVASGSHSSERQVVTSSRSLVPSVAVERPLVPNTSRFVVSQYMFHCFACGLQRNYLEQANPKVVEKTVREHMNTYHATSDAEAFLSRYLDSVNHCAVIEAFPGYKKG